MTDTEATTKLETLLATFMRAENCSLEIAQFFVVRAIEYSNFQHVTQLLTQLDALEAESIAAHGVGTPPHRLLRILYETGTVAALPIGRNALLRIIETVQHFTIVRTTQH